MSEIATTPVAPAYREDDTDKSCVIELYNLHGWALEPAFLSAIFKRAAERYVDEYRRVDIYPHYRTPSGFLQWVLRLHSRTGGEPLTVGVVQRQPDAEIEFHS
jgi:hypothetical protein